MSQVSFEDCDYCGKHDASFCAHAGERARCPNDHEYDHTCCGRPWMAALVGTMTVRNMQCAVDAEGRVWRMNDHFDPPRWEHLPVKRPGSDR